MLYYFFNDLGDEVTFHDFDECRVEAINNNQPKFRDTFGGEYFI